MALNPVHVIEDARYKAEMERRERARELAHDDLLRDIARSLSRIADALEAQK